MQNVFNIEDKNWSLSMIEEVIVAIWKSNRK